MKSKQVAGRDWGMVWIFLATGIVVGAVAFGSCVARGVFNAENAENAEKDENRGKETVGGGGAEARGADVGENCGAW